MTFFSIKHHPITSHPHPHPLTHPTDWLPANCKFYVDDIESPWTWSPHEAFDYIHGRGMGGSVADWPQLYTSIFENLKPGGWVEMQEYEAWISSDDDPELTKAPNTKLWQELVDEASTKFGKRMNVASEQKRWIEEAGFGDVREDVVKVSSLFLPFLFSPST